MWEIFKKELYSIFKWVIVIFVAGFTYLYFYPKYEFKILKTSMTRANRITGKVEFLDTRGEYRRWVDITKL